jgi:thiol-disulfide isomerase/thioredoxin
MRLIAIAAALLALAACHKSAPQPANEAGPAAEAGPQKGVDRSHKGAAIIDAKLLDPSGKETELRSLSQGKPLLLNLWATWCAPCVKELPTLQALHNQRGGSLIVMPVSQDDGPQPSVAAFLKSNKLNFAAYQDPKMALSGALGPDTVLPTTILYDANGKEVWRYVGDLDWTSAEAAKLLAEASAAPAKG